MENRKCLWRTQVEIRHSWPDAVDLASSGWGSSLLKDFQEQSDPPLKRANVTLFIGVDEANNLHVAHQTIRAKVLRGTPYVAADGVKTANIPDKIVFAHLGEGDIFDEFEAVKSSRSKQWHQRLPAYATRWAAKDRDLAVAMLAVDLTGLHGMTLPKNSSVHVVGGKTDAVKITPEGGVQWVQRKSQCPEH